MLTTTSKTADKAKSVKVTKPVATVENADHFLMRKALRLKEILEKHPMP